MLKKFGREASFWTVFLLFLAIVTTVGAVTPPKAIAAITDIWALPAPTGAADGDSWRVDLNGVMLPGTTNTYDIGSTSLYSGTVYANALKLRVTTVTANTTLTVVNGTQLFFAPAANCTITIPSAVVAGAGAKIPYQFTVSPDATHTVVVNATAGNINGSATKTFSNGTLPGGELVSNGSNWFATVANSTFP